MQVPSLTELLRMTEDALGEKLQGKVSVEVHTHNNEKLLTEITMIDTVKFREELRYTRDELKQKLGNPGAFCLMVYLDGEPIAFDYGYDESDRVYFSDTSATLIERKGIGKMLGVLELVHLYEKGYDSLLFTTEEMDEMGRPLRQIWENLGYKTVSVAPDGAVDMMLEITPEVVEERVRKVYNIV
jgi:hypothetical protein